LQFGSFEEARMPRGDKSKYTDKEKRQAEHIEEGYESRGVPEDEAERRAWATVNKVHGGGEKPGGSGLRKARGPRADAPRGAQGGKLLTTARQRRAARANVRKAASAASRKRTIVHLPKKTRTALGKQGAKVAREKKR
jgi:hypothetical protein